MFYWPWLGLNGAKTGPVCSVGGRPCPGRCTCSTAATQKEIKSGYLMRYTWSILGKCWRERYVVLYEDSTLAWFRGSGQRRPDGHLRISDAAADGLVAVAKWTLRIPTRPPLPPGYQSRLLGLGRRGSAAPDIVWLLAYSESEARLFFVGNEWIQAISTTLAPLASHFHNRSGKFTLTEDERLLLIKAEEQERQRQTSGETPMSMVGDMAVAATLNEVYWGAGKAWMCEYSAVESCLCPHTAYNHSVDHTHWAGHAQHIGGLEHIDADVAADADYSFDCADISIF